MTTPPTHDAAAVPVADDYVGWVVSTSEDTTFRVEVSAGSFAFIADEPVSVGGTGAGPGPYDYMLAAIGSCTAMTLRMYANRKQWPLDKIIVRLRHTPAHIKDCLECETSPVGPRRLDRIVEIVGGNLTDEQHKRLLQIADRCPVKQTFERGIQIRTVEQPQ
jgi:putative redox protein